MNTDLKDSAGKGQLNSTCSMQACVNLTTWLARRRSLAGNICGLGNGKAADNTGGLRLWQTERSSANEPIPGAKTLAA